jgi:mono/diheme cytochrome c family protein
MRGRPAQARLAILALGLALTACRHENMYTQPKAFTYGNSNILSRNMVMRHPVPGTVARAAPDAPVPQPKLITAAMLARGRQGFNANCVPCHDFAGSGHGMIVSRGFPEPPKLYSAKIRHFTARHIFNIITHGKGAMYGFGTLIEPAERWDIVAYVRALQLSQHAQVAALPARDQAELAKYALPSKFDSGSVKP